MKLFVWPFKKKKEDSIYFIYESIVGEKSPFDLEKTVLLVKLHNLLSDWGKMIEKIRRKQDD